MPLSKRQQHRLENIIASSEMEGRVVSEHEKKKLEAIMLGELSAEDAIADALRKAGVER